MNRAKERLDELDRAYEIFSILVILLASVAIDFVSLVQPVIFQDLTVLYNLAFWIVKLYYVPIIISLIIWFLSRLSSIIFNSQTGRAILFAIAWYPMSLFAARGAGVIIEWLLLPVYMPPETYYPFISSIYLILVIAAASLSVIIHYSVLSLLPKAYADTKFAQWKREGKWYYWIVSGVPYVIGLVVYSLLAAGL